VLEVLRGAGGELVEVESGEPAGRPGERPGRFVADRI